MHSLNQKRQHEELRRLRKSWPFKSVLKGWRVYFVTNEKYKGQCTFHKKKNIGYIFDWGDEHGVPPPDYIHHELLHIAFKAIYRMRPRQKHNAEEELIQHMCSALYPYYYKEAVDKFMKK